ncbi:MAG: XdhC family protein [Thermoanaerobaculia bacterium]|nr:XdhC family protein [Thermoanaerobaculia bacterium]
MREILPDIETWLAAGEEVAVATLVQATGSSPRPLGSKLAISSGGAMSGSVSGGCVEGAVFEEAQEVLRTGVPKRLHYGISDETAWSVGLTCGGEIDVVVEKLD